MWWPSSTCGGDCWCSVTPAFTPRQGSPAREVTGKVFCSLVVVCLWFVIGRPASGLTLAGQWPILHATTTTLKSNGHIVIPPKVRGERKLRVGDDFEVLADEDDPNVILLRRLNKGPKDDLVDVLLACPVKGFMPRIKRRKEGSVASPRLARYKHDA